ncbi:MAG: hypothetical protein ACM31C_27620 [Acidobacteriota bacterium]
MTAGLVIVVHGSERNRHVASMLQHEGLDTRVLDLPDSDVDAIADGIVAATDEIALASPDLPIGYFASGRGAAAALIAAARRPDAIAAVVSRCGRPDLSGASLAAVRAPTLMIVGGGDKLVVRANREAAARMLAPNQVSIILGASNQFAEPGTLDEVARLAASWFLDHFTPVHAAQAS